MKHYAHMHLFPDPTHPILGLMVSAVSGSVLWLAQTAQNLQPATEGWIQFGGTVGLIGGLSYACKTLWTELQITRKDSADLNKQMRDDWKAQNEKLISVLEKLDTDPK